MTYFKRQQHHNRQQQPLKENIHNFSGQCQSFRIHHVIFALHGNNNLKKTNVSIISEENKLIVIRFVDCVQFIF